MPPTDEQLVAAFQAGQLEAFDLLVERWDRKIFGAIYRLVGREEDARDLCQEAFLKAYRGLAGFKGEARFSSWVYQIALNLCRDRLRRRRGKTHVSLDEVDESAERFLVGPSALRRLEVDELSQTIAAAVEALPDEQREVIVLKEYQELTFPEIAEVLSLPVSTVKTRLYRGLGILRQSLEKQGIRSAASLPAVIP